MTSETPRNTPFETHADPSTHAFSQTDQGHELPIGPPQLMTSYTAPGQFDVEKVIGERDQRFGTDSKAKAEKRKDIPEPKVHPDADWAWKN